MKSSSMMRIQGMGTALLLLGALMSCSTHGREVLGTPAPPGLEMTGTVMDQDTRVPIDGAYVIAQYRMLWVVDGIEGGVATWCVKTLGMYTGPDGTYRFPVERLNGLTPYRADAIKPGYFLADRDVPKADVMRRQDATTYSNRNIYLKKQDAQKPDFRYGDMEAQYCDHAPTLEAAAAGLQFTRIILDESLKLGASQGQIDALKRQIKKLEGPIPPGLRR